MNLEPVTQSEVSHKEKSKYHTLTHMYWISENDADGLICRARIEARCRTLTCRPSGGREGRGSLREEHRHTCTHTARCKIGAGREQLQSIGNYAPCFVMASKAGMEGEVRGRLRKEWVQVCTRVCVRASARSDTVTLWTVARQAPLSMGISRRE